MSDVVLAAVAGGAALGSLAACRPLHPAQLWSIPWAIAAALFASKLLPYRELSWETSVIATLSVLLLIVGTLIGERVARAYNRGARHRYVQYVDVTLAAIAAATCAFIGLALFLIQAITQYGLISALNTSFDVRDAIGAGSFAITIKYVYFALAAVALSAAAAAGAPTRRSRWYWIGVAAICWFFLYFSTGRSTLVLGLVAGLVVYFVLRPSSITKVRYIVTIAVVMCSALSIFLLGGLLIGKTYDNNADLQQVPSVFRNTNLSAMAPAYEYASAPIAALDVRIGNTPLWGELYGCGTFADLCRGLNALGFDLHPVPWIRPFTHEPLPWNTYTALDAPLMDWGKLLTPPSFAIIGLLIGCLWSFTRRSVLASLAYGLIAAPALITGYGSFNFTAPHLVGACLISIALLGLAKHFVRRRQATVERSRPLHARYL